MLEIVGLIIIENIKKSLGNLFSYNLFKFTEDISSKLI